MANNNNTLPQTPITFKPGQRNILITSALPYVNNVPHLGNIVGSTLSADVFSRYCKLRGLNAIYICGTDEYGTATETKAVQEGLTCQEICDKYHKLHKEIYEWFDIKFDKFGRTSTPEQTTIAQDIFMKLNNLGNTSIDTIQQLYCEKCQKFLADRFVEGTCPLCGYSDARGDQCDKCGKLVNAVELINPVCKLDGTRPIIRSTEHLFLELPKLASKIDEWVESASTKGKWSENSIQITRAWLKEGLKPRCITRDLKWGIPVPLERFKDKVFYVWYDAPIGYISITATYTDEWEKWWKNPQEVELFQFMGKDNTPFHTVMFPASLIGSGEDWTLLHHLSTTEYLNYEGGKFSKSRGIGVFGSDAKATGIPSEIWRYYLLINRPENADSSFSWEDLLEKTNNELLANVGNFVNRPLTFVTKNFNGRVPSLKALTEEDHKLAAALNEELKLYINALDNVQIKDGLKIAMKISSLGNKYMQDSKPWELLQSNPDRCGTIIAVLLNVVHFLAAIFEPYMPALSAKIYKQLNMPAGQIKDAFAFELPENHVLGTPEILIAKLEPTKLKEFQLKFGGGATQKSEDAFPVDLRGGKIISVEDHPNDVNLYVAMVDLGSEQRQVVARLKAHYKKEELLGREVVVLCNLPPADLHGVKSYGMMLVAEGKSKTKEVPTKLLQPNSKTSSWVGSKLIAEGVPVEIKSPITLKEFQKLDLKLSKEGKVIWKQKFPVIAQTAEKNSLTAELEGPCKIK